MNNVNSTCLPAMPAMSRRQSLKLFGLMVAGATVPGLAACTSTPSTEVAASGNNSVMDAGHWPAMDIQPIALKGYGKDPNLIIPPRSPWPRTLTQTQLDLVARISAILVPMENGQPGALEVGAPHVVDEWVSAPYASQQRDRDTILRLLYWLDDEAERLYNSPFLALDNYAQMAILDSIAFGTDAAPIAFHRPAQAFNRLRTLILAAYFCSVPGSKEIGYMGNVAIAGDYPGPTEEAMSHLDDALASLGLTEYAYTPVGE